MAARKIKRHSPRRVVVTDPSDDTIDRGSAANPFPVLIQSGLVPFAHDFIDLGYDGSNRLTTVVYKTGGSGGTTVATLTIVYVGATQRIDTVTRT